MALNIYSKLGKCQRSSSASKSETSAVQSLFVPAPSQKPPLPDAQALPYGVSHSNVLVQKLNTIIEHSFPSETAVFTTTPASKDSVCHNALRAFGTPKQEFHYYLPHISNSTIDFYTQDDWVAYDIWDTDELAETEELVMGDVELPFIHEDDFQYYPEVAEVRYTSPRRSRFDDYSMDEDEDSLIDNERETKREKLAKKKEWQEFRLEKAVIRLVRKLKLKK